MSDNPYIRPDSLEFQSPETLDESEARRQIDQLREAIDVHDRRYYLETDPIVSDEVYDRLFERLQELEEQFPQLDDPNSPTRRVGAPAVDELETVEHVRPMLSLNSCIEEEEALDFDRFLRDQLGHDDFSYWAELKFDGLSVELVYEDGVLDHGTTRGDGYEGEEVTENLRTIPTVPLRLTSGDGVALPDRVVVRGEVFMPLEPFQQMNERRMSEGKDAFANPRNAAAGTLRQLDPSVVARRPLDIFVYDLMHTEPEIDVASQEGVFEVLPEWGFKVNQDVIHTESIEEVVSFRHRMNERREELDFEIDGIVIKVNEFDVRETLGERQTNPRWALAYKFEPRKEITTVQRIGVQVGRTGKLTPIAFLKPVDVGGVTISRASLHNFDEVRDKDIRDGDEVRVSRAGDVIPYVEERVDDRPNSERPDPFEMPDHCPVCGSEVIEEGAYHLCSGGLQCPAQVQGHLEHFVSRDAMDIEGLGEEQIRDLLDQGLVETVADIYSLTEDDLLEAGLFKNDTYIRLKSESDHPDVAISLYAAEISGVGPKTAIQVGNGFSSLEELLDASEEQIEERCNLGSRRARQLHSALSEESVRETLTKFAEAPGEAAARVGKSVHNLLREIEQSKSPRLDRFLYALGIRHVGSHVATVLARQYGSVKDLMEADQEELQNIDEIGPKVSRSIVEFFERETNRSIVHRLLERGVDPRPLETMDSRPLDGETFVFTGGLDRMTRDEAQQVIEQHGGRATSSVSGNTDYLVVGSDPGSTKMNDAEEHGTPILNEDEFYEFLQDRTGQPPLE